MSTLLDKGNFGEIDESFLFDSQAALQEVAKVQEKYDKPDTDTFLNEVHDSTVAKHLHYTHVNTEKHGFDACRKSAHSDCDFDFLEVKAASFGAKSLQATFNDTNLEKAALFQQKNVYLALSVWGSAEDLLFIAYGQNGKIGSFLEEKVKHFKNRKKTVRSTQTITLSKLINEYGFKIYAVSKSPDEIYKLLQKRNGCRNIPRESVLSIGDLPQPYNR